MKLSDLRKLNAMGIGLRFEAHPVPMKSGRWWLHVRHGDGRRLTEDGSVVSDMVEPERVRSIGFREFATLDSMDSYLTEAGWPHAPITVYRDPASYE
jgi:hypothetical protein